MNLSSLDDCARAAIGVGFSGARAADAPLDALRAFGPGAVILFARNVGTPHELCELVAALRALTPVPPLVTVDQEGGRVARLGADLAAALPSAMAFGAADDPSLTEAAGTLLGRDLARIGISIDFAPCADLALVPRSTVIGTRSFGDDPARVASHVGAFARGLERGGVAAALKHFPGHGSTGDDSHTSLPHVAAPADVLRARDLVPFARAIAEGAASVVMTTHVVVEAFDRDAPATLSRAVLTRLLREELGFEGVIVTDCLQMDAIANGVGTVEGVVRAIAAGADCALVSHDIDVARAGADALVAAVRDGRLPEARLRDAAARVLALRERFAQSTAGRAAVDETAPATVARRAVTVLRGDPVLHDDAVTVIAFEDAVADNVARSGAATGDARPTLSSALRRRRKKSEVMRVPPAPDADDVDVLLEHLPRLGRREFVIVARRSDLAGAQRAAIERILAAVPDAIVVAAREPFELTLYPQARRMVCAYGDDPLALDALADVLCGISAAPGTLPVRLPEPSAVR